MPQAKILGHQGDGLYTIELQMDWSILDRKINEYSDLVGALSPQVTTSENIYNNLKLEYDSLIADEETALNALIDVNNDPGSTDAEKKAATQVVIDAQKKVAEKRPALQNAYDKWQVLLAKKTSAQKQKVFYESYPRDNTITTAQAVDKADGSASAVLSGSYPVIPNGTFVDVYQLMREAKEPQWVIPAALVHNEETIPSLKSSIMLPANISGKIIDHELLHDAAMFWNSAMLSGYQRWNPHIRRGKIIEIGGSLFTVQLSPLLNSVDLAMQPESQDTFTFLVDYFCGPSAFRVNDFVIVKIDSWPEGGIPTGTVIGFADGPARECEYGLDPNLVPWPPINLLWGKKQNYKQFQTTWLRVWSSIFGEPVHVQDTHHNYGVAPFDSNWIFGTVDAKGLYTLKDDLGVPLAYDDSYPYESSSGSWQYTADIPALVQIIDTGDIAANQYELSGSDIIIHYQPPFVPVPSVFATGASIINPPNTNPFTGSIQNFIVHYNNPGPGTPVHPQGSAQAEYHLVSLGSFARFERVT